MTSNIEGTEYIRDLDLRAKNSDIHLIQEALRIQDENPEGRSSRLLVNESGLVCSVEFRRLLSWAINEDQTISHLSSVFIFDLLSPSKTRVYFKQINNPDRNLEVPEMESLSAPIHSDIYRDVVQTIDLEIEGRELSSQLQEAVGRLVQNELDRYETIEVKGQLFRSNAHVFRDMESIEKSVKMAKKLQLNLELKFPNLSS